MFLLAARIPEYDSFVKDRSNQVREGKESIRKFNNDPKFKFDLPFFTKDEIKGFIKKYIEKEFLRVKDPNGQTVEISAQDDAFFNNLSEKIVKETRGHPIMVKFSVLGEGLRTDVERRYTDYLSGDSLKMQCMLVCSLLDVGSLPIADAFLEDIGLLSEAYNLEHAILYKPSEGSWKTIHPRWDEEMLSFLYKENKGGELYDNKQYLKTALASVFNIDEEKTSATEERAFSVIGTIYDIAA